MFKPGNSLNGALELFVFSMAPWHDSLFGSGSGAVYQLNRMNDDAVLLRRYVEEGSEAAFAELVRRHVDLVYSAALRRTGGDPHHAADVAQQVFTALARHARKLSRHAVLAAWLHTATRNAALNLMISEQRRQARETEALSLESANATGQADSDWNRLRPLLDTAIDELSETDRAAVVLRFLERRPFAEIGAALQVSEDAARMRTDRALDKLRLALTRRGITSTATALGLLVSSQPVISAPTGLSAAVATEAFAAGSAGFLATTFASFMTTKIITSAAVCAFVVFGSVAYVVLHHDAQNHPLPPAPPQLQHNQPSHADNRQPVVVYEKPIHKTPIVLPPAPVVINSFKALAPGIPVEGGGFLTFEKGPSDPEEARKLVRARNGEAIDKRYDALYQQLGFSQEQIDSFRELNLTTIDARNDLLKEMRRTRPELQDRQKRQAVFREVVEKTDAVWLENVAEAFGEDVAAQVRDYQANGFVAVPKAGKNAGP